MNIFKYADSIDWMADYMDMNTGYVYHISSAQDHNTILVSDSSGNMIGQVTR